MAKQKEPTALILKVNDAQIVLCEETVGIAAQAFYTDVMENGKSAATIAETFGFIEKVHKQLKDTTDEKGGNKFTDLVREEIVRNSNDGKTYVTKSGTKLELMEAGVKYDYSLCADPIWNYYQQEMERLKEKIKGRETFLKTIHKKLMFPSLIVEEVGELHENVEIHPPGKVSTSTYKQTFYKPKSK